MAGTVERPEEIDRGDVRRQAVMKPGEVFLGNWPKLSKDPFVRITIMEDYIPAGRFGGRRLPQVVRELESSGQYASVRTIPAFGSDGKLIISMSGVVVRPKSTEPR